MSGSWLVKFPLSLNVLQIYSKSYLLPVLQTQRVPEKPRHIPSQHIASTSSGNVSTIKLLKQCTDLQVE